MSTAPIKIDDFYPLETFNRMKAMADTQETPFVVLDLNTISEHYDTLIEYFPY